MRKRLHAAAALALLAAACGCARQSRVTPVDPPRGFVFSHYRAPLTIEPEGTVLGPKMGVASTRLIGYPRFRWATIAWDKASISAAARQGGITKIAHADYELLSVLGVYSQFTVIVYGE